VSGEILNVPFWRTFEGFAPEVRMSHQCRLDSRVGNVGQGENWRSERRLASIGKKCAQLLQEDLAANPEKGKNKKVVTEAELNGYTVTRSPPNNGEAWTRASPFGQPVRSGRTEPTSKGICAKKPSTAADQQLLEDQLLKERSSSGCAQQ
jgi:hypothetical protein